jgi:hypothetical protein
MLNPNIGQTPQSDTSNISLALPPNCLQLRTYILVYWNLTVKVLVALLSNFNPRPLAPSSWMGPPGSRF